VTMYMYTACDRSHVLAIPGPAAVHATALWRLHRCSISAPYSLLRALETIHSIYKITCIRGYTEVLVFSYVFTRYTFADVVYFITANNIRLNLSK